MSHPHKPAQAQPDWREPRTRHPLLAVLRPSVLVVLALLLHLGPAEAWAPAARFLLLRGIELMVLVMYFWQFARHSPGFLEAAGVFLISGGFLFVVLRQAYVPAGFILVMIISWMAVTWLARRWPLVRGLTAASLLLVVLHAAMLMIPSLREHTPGLFFRAAFGLALAGLLILTALASSHTWQEQRLVMSTREWRQARFSTALLLLALTVQVCLGDVFRQLTQVAFAPVAWQTALMGDLRPVDSSGLLTLHRYWGLGTVLLTLFTAWKARIWLGTLSGLRWIPPLLLIMPVNQVVLGFYVLTSGRGEWITQMHVMNGLALWMLSCLLAAAVWAGSMGIGFRGLKDTAGKRASAG